MNRTSLWIVVAVAAAWIGFMLGYAVSAHTGVKPAAAAQAPAAGGYGCPPAKGLEKGGRAEKSGAGERTGAAPR